MPDKKRKRAEDLDDEDLDNPDQDEDEAGDEGEDDAESADEKRGQDLSKRPGIRDDLLELFDKITGAWKDQWDRTNDQKDYWDVYGCKLQASKQFYSGNAKIFVPIIKNAVDARKTRFTNQIFPASGRYVEATTSDGSMPSATAALLEYYVRKARLRTKVMPSLVKAGDIEGHYNVLVSWRETKRHVTQRVKVRPKNDDGTINQAADEVDDIEHSVLREGFPEVEVLADSDVLVLPQTADSIEEAIEEGGSVTVMRRFSKHKIKRMIRAGVFRKKEGEALIEKMKSAKMPPEQIDMDKHHVDAAGIKGEKGAKFAQVYQTWTLLEIKGTYRICECWYGGEDLILGARRNPLWSDRVPLLSVPVEKIAGVFKGVPKIQAACDLQYYANDAINEAADSAHFGMMPIVMTDPVKNPRVGSMILSMAAVWETSPKDTQVLQFPQLWQHGFELVNACKAEISQTLNVSPAAITQGVGAQTKQKRNQAEIAQEQQIDILTTADAVTVLEEGILTPFLNLALEMDHQYRDSEITIRAFGEMGLRAEMEVIPPVQMDKRYQFRWFGVEQVREQQRIQQQIAAMNVVRQIPPNQLKGADGQYEVNLVPIVTQLVENTFGHRLAPLIFIKPEDQMPVEPDDENLLLTENAPVPTHKMDDDRAHIQAHMAVLREMKVSGKPTKRMEAHIWAHVMQDRIKVAAAAGMLQQPGGEQAGGQGPPGRRGQSRPGASPAGATRQQGPPGMIPQDQMKSPAVQPRKMGFGR